MVCRSLWLLGKDSVAVDSRSKTCVFDSGTQSCQVCIGFFKQLV